MSSTMLRRCLTAAVALAALAAVVALAPKSGAIRCATVALNACSTSPCRRSSSQCCMMCTSSAIARTTMSGRIMLESTL